MKNKKVFLLLILCITSCNRQIDFKEATRLPLDELGFKKDFSEKLELATYKDREDGQFDPLRKKKITTNDKRPSSKYEKLFTDRKYVIYEHKNYLEEVNFYPDVVKEEDHYSVKLFSRDQNSIMPYPAYVDAIESNHLYSYVLNVSYYSNPSSKPIQERCYNLFYAIESDDDFPFSVYFDEECIYLMNKSHRYSNEYLYRFNKNEKMHLFKK